MEWQLVTQVTIFGIATKPGVKSLNKILRNGSFLKTKKKKQKNYLLVKYTRAPEEEHFQAV